MSIQTITTRELHERIGRGEPTELIDVRTAAEFRAVHATTAINLPLDQLDGAKFAQEHDSSSDQPIFMICKLGGRSQKACEAVAASGLTNVINVVGGTDAWVANGLPVNRDETQKTISIPRQVQITAGTIVLIGCALATMNPWFIVIPAFIGAGFVFAGLTDTCGMGMMLSKMPWNR